VVEGGDIVIAETAQEWVAACTRLFGDPDLAAKLGRAGRKLVEDQYGWDAQAAKLERFLLQLVEEA